MAPAYRLINGLPGVRVHNSHASAHAAGAQLDGHSRPDAMRQTAEPQQIQQMRRRKLTARSKEPQQSCKTCRQSTTPNAPRLHKPTAGTAPMAGGAGIADAHSGAQSQLQCRARQTATRSPHARQPLPPCPNRSRPTISRLQASGAPLPSSLRSGNTRKRPLPRALVRTHNQLRGSHTHERRQAWLCMHMRGSASGRQRTENTQQARPTGGKGMQCWSCTNAEHHAKNAHQGTAQVLADAMPRSPNAAGPRSQTLKRLASASSIAAPAAAINRTG